MSRSDPLRRVPLVPAQHRRARPPPRHRHRRRRLRHPRLPGRPGAPGRGPRLGRCTARHQLGPAGHVHRGRVDHGPHHDLQPADRDPPRLLAARALRLGRRHPRPALWRPGAASTSCPGRTTCTSTATWRATRPNATRAPRSSCGWSGGCGPRRTSRSRGEHFSVEDSTVSPRPVVRDDRIHPRLYFGGASEPAEKVSATESDVQLFWGEPLDGVAERIARLKGLEQSLERDLPPLEFGLRITTLVRDDDRGGVARRRGEGREDGRAGGGRHLPEAVPAQRLQGHRPAAAARPRGAGRRPGLAASTRHPAGTAAAAPATTWLVGSAEDVAGALSKYQTARDHPLRALGHAVPDRDRAGWRLRAAAAARGGAGRAVGVTSPLRAN